MNNRNETYRKSFSTVEESSEEYEQKMQLEEQLRVVMDKYKYKRRQIKELQEDIQSMQATADSLSAEEEQLIALFEEKEKLSQMYFIYLFSLMGRKYRLVLITHFCEILPKIQNKRFSHS